VTWGCYGTCAVSRDLAAHEREQAAQDESDTVYEHIRDEVSPRAQQMVIESDALFADYFCAWGGIDSMSHEQRIRLDSAVRLAAQGKDKEAAELLRDAARAALAAAADRYATDETSRLHDEWKRLRERRAA
jgi:hypothetical protein